MARRCCGSGKASKTRKRKVTPMNIPEGEQVKLRYMGNAAGYRQFFGLATNTGYRFGRAHLENTVHRDDVPGFLARYKGGQPEFALVDEPDKQPANEPADEPADEPDKQPAKRRGRPKKDADH